MGINRGVQERFIRKIQDPVFARQISHKIRESKWTAWLN
jgi:hypothetical protein